MIDKNTLIKVVNKDSGVVGYTIPELGVHRNFYTGESKEISFDELEKLTFVPGGETILREFLEVRDEEALNQLLSGRVEPEYHYSEADVRQLMETGSLDQFLDCLDFAPQVIKEMIKTLAVELPLNDVQKREAIKNKLGFDVTKAIEIKNTDYDGGDKAASGGQTKTARRAAPIKTAPAPTGRRYQPENK